MVMNGQRNLWDLDRVRQASVIAAQADAQENLENEDDLPPWVHHFDDITGQEDVIPEVSTIEIPLHESNNHLQKSGQAINPSQEFLAKDGVINHDHTSVTMKSAFADNGEFIIEAIPSVGETYRAEGLFPCPTIPHIQAKNFSELIPTIAMTTIQDI